MTAPFVIETHESREEWLKGRGIGSSDASTICGMNRWKGRFQLWAELTGKALPTEPGLPAAVGSFLEPFVHQQATEELNLDEMTPVYGAEKHLLVRDRERPWRTASPDALIVKAGLPTIKAKDLYFGLEGLRPGDISWLNEYKCSSRDWGEEPDAHAYIQVQHSLDILQVDEARIYLLVSIGRDWREFRVQRDPGFCEALEAHVTHFWEHHVAGDRPPEVDDKTDTAKLLDEMLTRVPKPRVTLPDEPEVRQLLEELDRTEIERKLAEKRERQLKSALKAMALGLAGVDLEERHEEWALDIVGPDDTTFRWRRAARRGYTVDPGFRTDLRRVGGTAK